MAGMPPVSKCTVENCFYNQSQQCHAPAINVGGDHPVCDTFIPQPNHIGRKENSSVGACHVSVCKYNSDLTCNASGIFVDYHSDHADCETFEPRG
ncbi:MAG TPA: DUF1540 domain-containing protein [Armatimonadota bacterium]|nr:DUF1540 domain-containing protein [Armatimonadota bacterium]